MGPQDKLNRYLQENRTKAFGLGVHDCVIWTNGAWAAMNGCGYADDLIAIYQKHGPRIVPRILKERLQVGNLEEAVDKRLTRVDGLPPRGALVATRRVGSQFMGLALGIANGPVAVFLGQGGYEPLPIDEIDGAWV